MNPSENKKSLDELLSRTVGRKPLKFDPDTWQKKYAQEIREYQARASSGPGTFSTHKRGTPMKSLIIKFAAAAGIMLAVFAGIGLFDNWFGGGNIAFADVLNNLQRRNYAFELVLTITEGDKQHYISINRAMIKEPGIMRFDSMTGGFNISSITDFNIGKTLLLFNANKSAVIMEDSILNDYSGAQGIVKLCTRSVATLWNLKDGTEKTLGTKQIDGQDAAGFQVSQEDEYFKYEMTIWAEVANSTPCLVEVVATPKKEELTQIKWTMRKFEMDVECDESQFSLEPPAGYTLAYQKKLEEMPAKGNASPTAKKIEDSLNLWTEGKKDQAVEMLLSIDWTLPVEFDRKPYIFTTTEQEYIALKAEDQKRVIEEVLASASVMKQIARHFLDLGQQAAANKEYERAEKIYSTNNHLGELLAKDPDRMIITRLVGIAVQKKTLNELVKLYTQTNNQEKLQAAQKQLELVTAWGDEIKRKVSGK
jgi:outer membrane lipoprotein-sorting protein